MFWKSWTEGCGARDLDLNSDSILDPEIFPGETGQCFLVKMSHLTIWYCLADTFLPNIKVYCQKFQAKSTSKDQK